jgi:carboxypeptidase D
MNISAFLYFFNLLWATPSVVFSRGLEKNTQFKVDSLPGIASLPASWAGRLQVPGAESGNEIFFWLFGSETLTYDENLISTYELGKGTGCGLLTLYSLVQWRSWLFILDRAGDRQWSLFV